nr:hypothetical protein [Tanacetum cinerariifolium]
MMIHMATPAVRDQQNQLSDYQALQLTETQNQLLDDVRIRNQLSKDHQVLQQVHLGCVGKEADLTKKLDAVEKERDDLLDKDREKEERIKQLEVDLANKTSSLVETEEGVKAACSEEEAEAFLATAVDYDPACKDTFMTEFDSLFNKSYPYVEKLVESFQPPLGDLHNSGRRVLDQPLVVRYATWPLALGHIRNVLRSGVRCVTWPLARGLIWNVLHSGRSMFRHSSSMLSFSLIIMVRCVGILISAGITASLPYMRLNGVLPLLCFREVRWAQTMLGSSSTHPALSLPNLALIPSIKLLLALSTRSFAYG